MSLKKNHECLKLCFNPCEQAKKIYDMLVQTRQIKHTLLTHPHSPSSTVNSCHGNPDRAATVKTHTHTHTQTH